VNTAQPRSAVVIKFAEVLTILTFVAVGPFASAAVKSPHMIALNNKFSPKNIPRTTNSTALESSGRENRRAIEEERLVVRTVVVSFAKSPLNAAAMPLPTARWSQDIVWGGDLSKVCAKCETGEGSDSVVPRSCTVL